MDALGKHKASSSAASSTAKRGRMSAAGGAASHTSQLHWKAYTDSASDNMRSYLDALRELLDNCCQYVESNLALRPPVQEAMEVVFDFDDDPHACAEAANGGRHFLAVVDNGCGMDMDGMKEMLNFRFPKEQRVGELKDGHKLLVESSATRRMEKPDEETQISKFGVGAKAAAFFMGDGMRVITKKAGQAKACTTVLSRAKYVKREKDEVPLHEILKEKVEEWAPQEIVDKLEDEEEGACPAIMERVKEAIARESYTIVIVRHIKPRERLAIREEWQNEQMRKQLADTYHFLLFPEAYETVMSKAKGGGRVNKTLPDKHITLHFRDRYDLTENDYLEPETATIGGVVRNEYKSYDLNARDNDCELFMSARASASQALSNTANVTLEAQPVMLHESVDHYVSQCLERAAVTKGNNPATSPGQFCVDGLLKESVGASESVEGLQVFGLISYYPYIDGEETVPEHLKTQANSGCCVVFWGQRQVPWDTVMSLPFYDKSSKYLKRTRGLLFFPYDMPIQSNKMSLKPRHAAGLDGALADHESTRWDPKKGNGASGKWKANRTHTGWDHNFSQFLKAHHDKHDKEILFSTGDSESAKRYADSTGGQATCSSNTPTWVTHKDREKKMSFFKQAEFPKSSSSGKVKFKLGDKIRYRAKTVEMGTITAIYCEELCQNSDKHQGTGFFVIKRHPETLYERDKEWWAEPQPLDKLAADNAGICPPTDWSKREKASKSNLPTSLMLVHWDAEQTDPEQKRPIDPERVIQLVARHEETYRSELDFACIVRNGKGKVMTSAPAECKQKLAVSMTTTVEATDIATGDDALDHWPDMCKTPGARGFNEKQDNLVDASKTFYFTGAQLPGENCLKEWWGAGTYTVTFSMEGFPDVEPIVVKVVVHPSIPYEIFFFDAELKDQLTVKDKKKYAQVKLGEEIGHKDESPRKQGQVIKLCIGDAHEKPNWHTFQNSQVHVVPQMMSEDMRDVATIEMDTCVIEDDGYCILVLSGVKVVPKHQSSALFGKETRKLLEFRFKVTLDAGISFAGQSKTLSTESLKVLLFPGAPNKLTIEKPYTDLDAAASGGLSAAACVNGEKLPTMKFQLVDAWGHQASPPRKKSSKAMTISLKCSHNIFDEKSAIKMEVNQVGSCNFDNVFLDAKPGDYTVTAHLVDPAASAGQKKFDILNFSVKVEPSTRPATIKIFRDAQELEHGAKFGAGERVDDLSIRVYDEGGNLLEFPEELLKLKPKLSQESGSWKNKGGKGAVALPKLSPLTMPTIAGDCEHSVRLEAEISNGPATMVADFTLTTVAGEAKTWKIEVDREDFECGAEIGAAVVVHAVDAHGNLARTDATPEIDIKAVNGTDANLGQISLESNGVSLSGDNFELSRGAFVHGERQNFRFTVSGGGLGPCESLEVELSAGAPHHISIVEVENAIVADPHDEGLWNIRTVSRLDLDDLQCRICDKWGNICDDTAAETKTIKLRIDGNAKAKGQAKVIDGEIKFETVRLEADDNTETYNVFIELPRAVKLSLAPARICVKVEKRNMVTAIKLQLPEACACPVPAAGCALCAEPAVTGVAMGAVAVSLVLQDGKPYTPTADAIKCELTVPKVSKKKGAVQCTEEAEFFEAVSSKMLLQNGCIKVAPVENGAQITFRSVQDTIAEENSILTCQDTTPWLFKTAGKYKLTVEYVELRTNFAVSGTVKHSIEFTILPADPVELRLISPADDRSLSADNSEIKSHRTLATKLKVTAADRFGNDCGGYGADITVSMALRTTDGHRCVNDQTHPSLDGASNGVIKMSAAGGAVKFAEAALKPGIGTLEGEYSLAFEAEQLTETTIGVAFTTNADDGQRMSELNLEIQKLKQKRDAVHDAHEEKKSVQDEATQQMNVLKLSVVRAVETCEGKIVAQVIKQQLESERGRSEADRTLQGAKTQMEHRGPHLRPANSGYLWHATNEPRGQPYPEDVARFGWSAYLRGFVSDEADARLLSFVKHKEIQAVVSEDAEGSRLYKATYPQATCPPSMTLGSMVPKDRTRRPRGSPAYRAKQLDFGALPVPAEGYGRVEYAVNMIELKDQDEGLRDAFFFGLYQHTLVMDTVDAARRYQEAAARLQRQTTIITRDGWMLASNTLQSRIDLARFVSRKHYCYGSMDVRTTQKYVDMKDAQDKIRSVDDMAAEFVTTKKATAKAFAEVRKLVIKGGVSKQLQAAEDELSSLQKPKGGSGKRKKR